MEKLGDSIHAVSDAMTELLGTTAMTADQKMDESRLQLKLAAAEARDNVPKLKHGQNNRSLSSLLEQLEKEYPDSFNGFGIQ